MCGKVNQLNECRNVLQTGGRKVFHMQIYNGKLPARVWEEIFPLGGNFPFIKRGIFTFLNAHTRTRGKK